MPIKQAQCSGLDQRSVLKREVQTKSVSLPMRLSLYGCITLTWEDMALEVTLSSVGVKCTYKTFGWVVVHLPWLVNLALLVCNVGWWLSGRVSALPSVVAGSISCGGDHGIRCWWDLIRLKQLSSIFVCHTECMSNFLVMVIQSIYMRVIQKIKWYIYIYICLYGIYIYIYIYMRDIW